LIFFRFAPATIITFITRHQEGCDFIGVSKFTYLRDYAKILKHFSQNSMKKVAHGCGRKTIRFW